MIEGYIDLHTHSNKSDGSDSPSELIKHAAHIGLLSIAITDHDTLDGIDEAIEASKDINIEVIPGIEFSVEYNFSELHIVGLFIDHKDNELNRIVNLLSETRKTRNEQIAERLKELSIELDYDKLPRSGEVSITRAHFAKLLIEKGYCKNTSEAFNKYLGFGAPAYVPRKKLPVNECIKVIHRAGGIAILAHLNQIELDDDTTLLKLLSDLKDLGLDGIECCYPEYDKEFEKECLKFADIFDYAISGGSDYHGDNKDNELGIVSNKSKIPLHLLKKIKKRMADKL